MQLHYSHLFRGLDINLENLQILDSRINETVTNVINRTANPFQYVAKYASWQPTNALHALYPEFPNGGYNSNEQATIALALWRIAPKKPTYDTLYMLSKFICDGYGK